MPEACSPKPQKPRLTRAVPTPMLARGTGGRGSILGVEATVKMGGQGHGDAATLARRFACMRFCLEGRRYDGGEGDF